MKYVRDKFILISQFQLHRNFLEILLILLYDCQFPPSINRILEKTYLLRLQLLLQNRLPLMQSAEPINLLLILTTDLVLLANSTLIIS